MCCRSAVNSVSARLSCYVSKGFLKAEFLDIYIITFFGVCKFKNPSAMRVIFFLKMFRIQSKIRKFKKINSESLFRFSDNCILKCCNNLPLLRQESFSSAHNGLRKSPKILHIIQRDFFNLNILHRD